MYLQMTDWRRQLPAELRMQLNGYILWNKGWKICAQLKWTDVSHSFRMTRWFGCGNTCLWMCPSSVIHAESVSLCVDGQPKATFFNWSWESEVMRDR